LANSDIFTWQSCNAGQEQLKQDEGRSFLQPLREKCQLFIEHLVKLQVFIRFEDLMDMDIVKETISPYCLEVVSMYRSGLVQT
jgi:hypothetical protein